MVILDRIDPASCRLAWVLAPTELPGDDDPTRVEHRLRQLGILRSAPFGARAEETFDHHWEVGNDLVEYRSAVDLSRLSTREHAFYAASLLATVTWAPVEELMSVHLALYELIVNVYEHGRALPIEIPELRLRLRISQNEIEGWLEDGCERFDPADRAPIDIPNRLARRESRGYGVAMIQRALDEISYDFGPGGNTVHFKKRIHT